MTMKLVKRMIISAILSIEYNNSVLLLDKW